MTDVHHNYICPTSEQSEFHAPENVKIAYVKRDIYTVVERSDKLLIYSDYNLYSGIFHDKWVHEVWKILALSNNDEYMQP